LSDLVAAIQALQEGQPRCSGSVVELVLRRIRELSAVKHHESRVEEFELTRREIEVLGLVEQGFLNKEIARQLGITISTVKNHLHAIFEKLQVNGRRQAVRQGIAVGILRCESAHTVRDGIDRLAC
jgi:DNA-binding NarL/FixJ family response regulator